jgi:HSP20 family molecular chaperone IbpA
VEPGKTKARFKKGILTVTLPKAEPDKKNRKVVEIAAG